MTCRPPREVTRDLPRSYQAKLLDKYTQTLGSWQQRRIAVSDPAAEGFIWHTCCRAARPHSTKTPAKTQLHKPLCREDFSSLSLSVSNTPVTAVYHKGVRMLKCSLSYLHPGFSHILVVQYDRFNPQRATPSGRK